MGGIIQSFLASRSAEGSSLAVPLDFSLLQDYRSCIKQQKVGAACLLPLAERFAA